MQEGGDGGVIAGGEFDASEFEARGRMISVQREERLKVRFSFGKTGAFDERLSEAESGGIVGGGKLLDCEGEIGEGEIRFLLELNEAKEVEPAAGGV